MSPGLSHQSSGADIVILVPEYKCAAGKGHGIDLALRLSDSGVFSPSDVSSYRRFRHFWSARNMRANCARTVSATLASMRRAIGLGDC